MPELIKWKSALLDFFYRTPFQSYSTLKVDWSQNDFLQNEQIWASNISNKSQTPGEFKSIFGFTIAPPGDEL